MRGFYFPSSGGIFAGSVKNGNESLARTSEQNSGANELLHMSATTESASAAAAGPKHEAFSPPPPPPRARSLELQPLTPLEAAARNFRGRVGGGGDDGRTETATAEGAAICGVGPAQCDRGSSDHVERLKVWRSILPDRFFLSQAEQDQLYAEYRRACGESALAREAIAGPSPAWVQPRVGLGARAERGRLLFSPSPSSGDESPLLPRRGRDEVVGFTVPMVQVRAGPR